MDITETTPAKTAKIIPVKKVLDAFNTTIDVNQDYSLDELKKLLSTSYKTAGKRSKGTKGDNTEKREPSKYNLFVKDEMLRLKAEHPDKSNKEIMSMAAALWKESKAKEEEPEPVV